MTVDQRVRTDLEARLTATAQEIDDNLEALRVARERRDRLVVQAIDEQIMSTKAIARVARISQSRVMGILADPPPSN
jgi:DNA-directed RNA polymerase specialized sigma subunit